MIRVSMGEPTAVGAEGILRSVYSDLTPDTAFSRELEVGAGAEVSRRLHSMGDLPIGAAVITPAGDLPASFLIHVVLQSPEEPVRIEGARSALRNGLRRAQEWELESLALPALGSGAGNLDPEDSASAMIPIIRDHLLQFEHPREVIIVLGTEYEKNVFSRAVELAEQRTPAREG